MIGRLRGELVELDGPLALVDVGGVGYEVTIPDSVAAQLSKAESVTLLIRQIFREDGVTLYGFSEPFQRRLFDLLLSVKGCGPKGSLALIGQLGEDAVATAILAQDARVLARATGIGPRLAERIILELRDKIQEESFLRKIEAAAPKRKAPPADELIEALLALGYRRGEVEALAEEARRSSSDVEEQLRHALRLLQR
jgi:Holliday junction DNA helicase RuvA